MSKSSARYHPDFVLEKFQDDLSLPIQKQFDSQVAVELKSDFGNQIAVVRVLGRHLETFQWQILMVSSWRMDVFKPLHRN